MVLNEENVKIERNVNDELIITVENDNEKILLNSNFNTEDFVDIWCSQYDISNPFSVAIVVGVSDGRYINKLHSINKEMTIVVYEPYERIAKLSKEMGYLNGLDPKKVVVLVGEKSMYTFSHILGSCIGYENQKYTKCFISPNYELICPEAVKTIMHMVKREKESTILTCNTMGYLGDFFRINTKKNLLDRINQYAVIDMIKLLKNMDKKNIPAIIVAAGPSLDKNIKELKNAVGKAFIIAVDTSLNALAKENIIPDVCVTIDPIKPVSLLADEKMKNIPLIYHFASNYEIAEIHKGKRFYQDSTETLFDYFIKKFKKDKMFLETGGSVANDACSLACLCQFSTIIFIGQDLAYPNDKEHSDNSYGAGHNNVIDSNDERYFYVEDIEGNMVKTEYNMNMYRMWFEDEVKTHEEIKFIDATEGGAKIHGMEIMTLREALEEFCINDTEIDFRKKFDSIEPQFSVSEQREILEYIADYENVIKRIKKKIRQGITYYNNLEEYNRKQIYSGKGFESTYKKISKVNKWLAYDEEVCYLRKYMNSRVYEVLGKIYEEKDTLYDELKFLVDNGRKSLEEMLNVSDEVLADYRDNIAKAKEMLKEYEGI